MSTYTEDRRYYPTGYDDSIEWHRWNIHTFTVHVTYRGHGKWMVSDNPSGLGMQLSQTGKWLSCPLKMTAMRWCRFDFETACQLAESAVDEVRINGLTWAEYMARRASRTDA